MAQWGRNDQAVTANDSTTAESSNGAPIGTYVLVKGGKGGSIVDTQEPNTHFGNTSSGSRASVDSAMFNNTTIGAFIGDMAVGIFGVSANEAGYYAGNVALGRVTFGGSGYGANTVNATLTVVSGGTGAFVNGIANTTAGGALAGRITGFNITAGSGYIAPPTMALAAPAAINIYANTANGIPLPTANNIYSNSTTIDGTNHVIKIATANTLWNVGDRLYYAVPATNTAITGLTANSYYYVSFANSSSIALAATLGGSNIAIVNTAANETHTIQGDGTYIKVATASSKWQANDRFYYGVPTSNTALGGLTGNSYYYVTYANTSGIKISATKGGANITFGAASVPTAGSPEIHTIQGDTATGVLETTGSDVQGVAHAGWVVRREGTGGRAGRVHYETLVAMGSLGAQTAAYGTPATTNNASTDNIIFPGA